MSLCSTGAPSNGALPSTRLAWFYMRPADGTTPLTLVQRDQVMILSGSDWELGFLQAVRAAGWTKPVLEYIDLEFAMGPSSAMTGTCPAGYEGFTTTWTPGANEFCQKVNPNESWFLHNGAGQRIYRDDGNGNYYYQMNPNSPGWRAYVQAKAASQPSTYRMDGVFLDDVWATADTPRHHEDNSDGTCRECGTDAQWLQAQRAVLQAIKAGAGKRPVWINSDNATLAQPVDGLMIEDMGATWNGAYMTQPQVESRWREVDALVAANKDALLVGQGDSKDDIERMRFAHAVYMMVAGPHVSFRFQNADDYRALWDYPEFHLALGAPTRPRHRVGPSTWRRDFKNGVALVNLSDDRAQTVRLGGAYRLPDGGTATQVGLPPHHGLVLARAR